MSLPYDYYPAVLYAINLYSQGFTKTEACLQSNISTRTLKEYVERDPHLTDMMADAEQAHHDTLADALINIDQNVHGHPDPRIAKVLSENIKWVLSRRDSKRFGDKVEVKHEVTLDRAITDALNAARTRALPPPEEQDVIDAEYFYADDDDEITRDLLS